MADEIQVVADLLKKLEPGKLPLPIFLETARLTVTPIVEIVPLRLNNGKIQVLLTKREDNDPNWPGMLHTPGTVVRASDKEGNYEDAFKRIIEGELQGTLTSDPVFVESILHKVKRGMESALVYWMEVKGDPATGDFYDLDQLPDNIVDTQIEFIKRAGKHFQNQISI